MPSFIDSCEGKVAILPHLAVLNTIYNEGFVTSSVKIGLVGIVDIF